MRKIWTRMLEAPSITTRDGEIAIDLNLARQLLIGQHPDLAELPIAFVASGLDNLMFRLGDCLALRLPRRQLGADFLLNEQRWLPVLSQRLPLRVPAPVRVGFPHEG